MLALLAALYQKKKITEARSAIGGAAIFTHPCILSMENRDERIPGGAQLTSQPGARRGTLEARRSSRRGWPTRPRSPSTAR